MLITVVVSTSPCHQWVYRGAGASQLTGSDTWAQGPAFWLHTGYSYLALVTGIGFIFWGWWKAPPAFRLQRLTIFLATLIPCAANVIYLARGFGNLGDPTPFGFAVADLVIFYAMFFVALPHANAAKGLAFADNLRRRFELREIIAEGR